MKDFYGILGVEKTATEKEIKRAYRRLALQYHPDRNNGNPGTTQKFKEVTEAFQELSDLKKRTKYDSFGRPYSRRAVDLEGRVGLSRAEMETLDKEKLFRFQEDYQRLQSVSKMFSAVIGVSAGMFGSYAVYEQFKDAGNYGFMWLFLSFIVGYSGFYAKIEAGKALKEKKIDIERLANDIKHNYGSR